MHVLVFQQVGTFLCVCVCDGEEEKGSGEPCMLACRYGMHTCEIFISTNVYFYCFIGQILNAKI